MSYSIEQKCGKCKKETSCADGMIIRKAVEMIHMLPSRYEGTERVGGHQGGGTVIHDCVYSFEEKTEKE